jgi:hypothetical protein
LDDRPMFFLTEIGRVGAKAIEPCPGVPRHDADCGGDCD